MNLGHGALQGTPEENVKAFCEAARDYEYADATDWKMLSMEKEKETVLE